MLRPRAYLAGPEVFLRDAMEISRRKRELCERHGVVGVSPLDGEPSGATPRARGLSIHRANEHLIRDCDLLIANVTPFRGPHMDPGTAYEIGFMRALGRSVLAYTNCAPDLAVRLEARGPVRDRPDGEREDAEGLLVEDFGFAENLMIDGAVVASGIEVERHACARIEDLYRDLTAFERCVVSARALTR